MRRSSRTTRAFDIAFLNAELKLAGKPPIATERVIDTVVLARRKHAGGPTLDDLCSRYGVDRSHRTQHGALLDAELLAAVYVELVSERQAATQADMNRNLRSRAGGRGRRA
jgi:DNA polymerase III subunit epsilon